MKNIIRNNLLAALSRPRLKRILRIYGEPAIAFEYKHGGNAHETWTGRLVFNFKSEAEADKAWILMPRSMIDVRV